MGEYILSTEDLEKASKSLNEEFGDGSSDLFKKQILHLFDEGIIDFKED